MDYKLLYYSKWPIYRLDVCYNWIFKSEAEATYAMDFLRRIDYPCKKKYTYDTSVMYKGSAYTIKFYVKGAEFLAHDFKKIDANEALRLQLWADQIVRFEVNLKRTYLQETFLSDTVYLESVSDDDEILEILKYYLEKKVFLYLNANSMTDETIKQILYDNFTKMKATRLYQFYKDFYFNDEMKNMFIRGGLNRSTIYRYKKELKRVGIGISVEKSPDTKNILEKLIIPSPTSCFDLVAYPLTEE